MNWRIIFIVMKSEYVTVICNIIRAVCAMLALSDREGGTGNSSKNLFRARFGDPFNS